jgi:hypothetical protein
VVEASWHDDCHGRVDAGSTRAWDHHWQSRLEGQFAVRRVCVQQANDPQPRYVVLSTGAALKAQNEFATNTDNSVKSSRKGLKAATSKPSLVDVAQPGPADRRLYISIYKAKVGFYFFQPRPFRI